MMLKKLLNTDKNTEKNIKKIITISLFVLIIIIISLIIFFIVNRPKKTEIISSSSFTSVEEVIEYMESEYIGKSRTSGIYNNNIFLKFKVKPVENDNIYENYYTNMVRSIASVLKYDNFKLTDEENNITVSVICDSKYKIVKSIDINGDVNYFENAKSKLNLENYSNINNVNVKIDSSVLLSLIKNNFIYNENIFGIKKSTLGEYDIYFEEGIKARNVNNKVFNIVFTNKYKNSVVNNIKVGTNFEDIKKILGEPIFTDDYFIGYKSDKFYIFFLENQISIYRVDEYDTKEFAKVVTQFLNEKNSKNLANNLINIWPDFDEIRFEGNSINLLYTLKGINIQFNYILKHGIHVYSNFKGDIAENLSINSIVNNPQNMPENIYFKSEDLVYQNEIKRAHSIQNINYFYPHFKILVNDVENILANGGYVEDTVSGKDDNGKFIIYKEMANSEENNTYILSVNDESISSQLDINITSHIWISDNILAYSIKDDGIYLYDVINFTTKELLSGIGNFELKSYENGILKYDDKEKNISI